MHADLCILLFFYSIFNVGKVVCTQKIYNFRVCIQWTWRNKPKGVDTVPSKDQGKRTGGFPFPCFQFGCELCNFTETYPSHLQQIHHLQVLLSSMKIVALYYVHICTLFPHLAHWQSIQPTTFSCYLSLTHLSVSAKCARTKFDTYAHHEISFIVRISTFTHSISDSNRLTASASSKQQCYTTGIKSPDYST